MAYAFDKVTKALGKGNKSGIFGLTGDEGEGSQETSGGPGPTTTTEGDLSGPSGGSSFAPTGGQVQQQQSSTSGDKNRIITRNQGRVRSPVDVNRLTSNIGDAKTKIQQEADTYLQAADDPYELQDGKLKADDNTKIREFSGIKVQDDIEDQALGLNEEAAPVPVTFDGAKNNKPEADTWLTKFQNAPGLVDDLTLNTSTDFQEADLMQNNAGLAELLRRQADPEYSSGEAALDTTLLQNDGNFLTQRDDALRSYRDLKAREAEIKGSARDFAQGYRNEAADKWKEAVGNELQTNLGRIESGGAIAERDFDQQLEDGSGFLPEYAREIVETKRLQGDEDQGLYEMFDLNRDLSNYIRPDAITADKTSWQDFLSEDELGSYNRVLSTLGRGDFVSGGRGLKGKDAKDVLRSNFDADTFLSEGLTDARQRKQAADNSPFAGGYDTGYERPDILQNYFDGGYAGRYERPVAPPVQAEQPGSPVINTGVGPAVQGTFNRVVSALEKEVGKNRPTPKPEENLDRLTRAYRGGK